jgi:hypothetical protein
MTLKKTRNELLKDPDSSFALDFAVKNKRRQDPKISQERILDTLILPIAYHESKLDPQAVQSSGGPARGLMQFEPNSLITAATRAKNILTKNGYEVPKYVNKILDEKIFDARKLTSGQQAALAVFDLLEKPKANITTITSDIQHVKWFWADFWWAGKYEDRINRMASFTESYKNYLMEYRNNIQTKLTPEGFEKQLKEVGLPSTQEVLETYAGGGAVKTIGKAGIGKAKAKVNKLEKGQPIKDHQFRKEIEQKTQNNWSDLRTDKDFLSKYRSLNKNKNLSRQDKVEKLTQWVNKHINEYPD